MLLDIEIGFYKEDRLKLKVTHDEYKEILEWIDRNSNDNSFVTFDIENGAGEITFRPDDVKYLKY